MKGITLTEKEQKVMWAVLNQAQHFGLQSLGKTLEETRGIDTPMINDWIKQTQEEYDVINTLKVKLCTDLK